MSSSTDAVRRQQLAERCDRQVQFASGYAPLYARLFGLVASWLRDSNTPTDPFVRWLIDTGRERTVFDVPLLLVAALHREVLSGTVPELARFYPTAGGDADYNTPEFEQIVRDAILHRPKTLTPFIQTANVQTNETARGMIWLLPLQAWRVPAVHLVDLGAGAGLNLVAEQRNYRFYAADHLLLQIGKGQPPQFATRCNGALDTLPTATATLPRIASRLGCDMLPFALDSAEKELTLSAYVWGDQAQRLQRLREGIAAFHANNTTETPVQISAVTLPDQLETYLQTVVAPRLATANSAEPIIFYNTYVTNYLPDKGASLHGLIDRWATQQARPVLWLQWEPTYGRLQEPEYGWIAYSADLWRGAIHDQWHLGWVHPHGIDFAIDPSWASFCAALQE